MELLMIFLQKYILKFYYLHFIIFILSFMLFQFYASSVSYCTSFIIPEEAKFALIKMYVLNVVDKIFKLCQDKIIQELSKMLFIPSKDLLLFFYIYIFVNFLLHFHIF